MVRKIELFEEKEYDSYVLKVFLNLNSPQPFMLFNCSYIDRPKEEALAQILVYEKEFSKTYSISLEENLT